MLVAGAIQTLVYAPFSYWPLGLISAGVAFFLLHNARKKESLILGWLYGFGIFGTGASWVYISINTYGNAPVPLAIFLTFLYVAFLSFFTVFQFFIYQHAQPKQANFLAALLFASTWVITDWFRSWFLTGFPWLYLGHSHLDTFLAGLAPVGGVHALTWCSVFTGAAVIVAMKSKNNLQRALPVATTVAIWTLSWWLQSINWTEVDDQTTLTVAIAQGNVPQELKWDPEYRMQTILTYQQLSDNYWGSDIILWPETAIPILLDQASSVTEPLAKFALENTTTVITGIPYRAPYLENGRPVYHNSIVSLGNGDGVYHKQKLVPFGEYVPLESFLRGLIQFFDLPMSSFIAGPSNQKPLRAGEYKVSPFICYEVVYPEFVARAARDSELLVTISNDAWFGGSIGPHQHLEMAQMRALETGRYLIRGTNSGISAIVNAKGQITARSIQFEEATLSGTVHPASGSTPFMTMLSWPVLLLCFAIIAIARQTQRKRPNLAQ